MVRRFSQDDGSFLIPVEIPFPTDNKDDVVDDHTQMLKEARDRGIRVDFAKLGFREFLAMLVPGTRSQFRAYVANEFKDQRDTMNDGRCPVYSESDGIMRCPLYKDNPEYDPVTNPDVPKMLKMDCATCEYFTLDLPNYKRTVFSNLEKEDEDGNIMSFDVPVGFAPDSEKYDKVRDDVLALIAEKYPDKLEQYKMQFEEISRSEASKILDKNTSTLYKMPKEMKKDLLDILDGLAWLITMDTDKYRN